MQTKARKKKVTVKSKHAEEYAVGTIHQTDMRLQYTVVEFNLSSDIKIKFTNTGNIVNTIIGCLRRGTVKDRMEPSLYEVAFMGVGKFTAGARHRSAYRKWRTMLAACYGGADCKVKRKYECFVCYEWLNYQNFASWLYEHHTESDLVGLKLHKDANFKFFSPESCTLKSIKKQGYYNV